MEIDAKCSAFESPAYQVHVKNYNPIPLFNLAKIVGKTVVVVKVFCVNKSYLVHLYQTRGINRNVADSLFKTLVVSDKT